MSSDALAAQAESAASRSMPGRVEIHPEARLGTELHPGERRAVESTVDDAVEGVRHHLELAHEGGAARGL